MRLLSTFIILLITSSLHAQPFSLVKEINTTANGSSIASTLMARVGSTVYFVANDGITGAELWKSDGTEQGTVMVKDINPGPGSTSFANFTEGDGLLFFTANDGVNGFELWRTDGSSDGTFMLRDGFSECTFCLNRYFFHNGILYFAGDDGTGAELWKTDGTVAGTVLVKDIFPGPTTSHPAPTSNAAYTFVAMGNDVYFTAVDALGGRELFKTDGTAAGTVMIKDIFPGATSGISTVNHKAAVFNGKVFFVANDGINGVELWATNGTEAGTYLVADIAPGSAFSSPNNLIVFNGALYFTASPSGGNPNLYKTDGTAAGTVLVRDFIADGVVLSIGNSAAINDFTVAANKLFFRASAGATGLELYATDGSTSGTGLVKDIYPGSLSSSPSGFIEMNGKLYFTAFDPGLQRSILFSSDGSETGTVSLFEGELRDVLGISASRFISTGTKFFFWGNNQDGAELWCTDGSSAGTAMVKNINTTITGTPNLANSPFSSVEMNGYRYFAAGSEAHGMELWKSNGTTAGTTMVKDIWPGKGPSSPLQFFKHGGYIYFSANDGVHGNELWRTDGTEGGTVMVKDINPGNAGSNPLRFTLSNNYIYFSAYTAEHGNELWRTDGTEAGTTLVLDLVSGPAFGLNIVEGFTINDDAFLTAGIGAGNSLGIASGTKLIRVNGAGNTISELSSTIVSAQDITVSGNTLYIGGRNAANQTLLWKSVNGGAIEQVKLLSNTAVTIFQLTDCGGKIYFGASDGTAGLEPWVSDGTEAGTFMLKDINPGSGNSTPYQFVQSGGKVFFTAASFVSTGISNTEIYITDGTESGTYLLKDIVPGATGSRPSGPMIAYPANKVLFTANDGVNGIELWQSDGTNEGTTLLQDINSGNGDGFNFPGILINFPTEHLLNRVGDGLIFFARNATTGLQLYGGSMAATYYVNDNSQTGDVFTTAVGNDANPGTSSAPFASLAFAIAQAKNGDTIYVDAGTYTEADFMINKSVTIRGANYLISPNDATDPLLTNAGRNAESVISNCLITIGAGDIVLEGLTFDPLTKTAIRQNITSADYDNISIRKNRFLVNSGSTAVNLTGKQVFPLVTLNYAIDDNRFIKSVSNLGTAISLAAIDQAQITNNCFTVSGASGFNSQTSYSTGVFRMDNLLISNNAAYRQNNFAQTGNTKTLWVTNNKAVECNRFTLAFNSLSEGSVTEITDNIVIDPKATNGGPTISYARSNGTNLAQPGIARIDRNTITLNGTGLSGVAQALIAPTIDNLSLNTEVYIRNNVLKISGDFSSQSHPSLYVSAIRFLNNSRKAYVENNELEFTATNFGVDNKFGIGTLNSGLLMPDAVYEFKNNKISGFPTSIGLSNGAGFGNLPIGMTVNINNNSFTGDVMSINNGSSSQSIDASCNWYGSAAAQDFINKVSLGTVDIVPWLTNGTDSDPAVGFQPATGACDGYPTLITLDNSSDITCHGANNGSIQITASYGRAPTTYTWTKDGDPGFISHDEDPSNLSPGTYRLSLVDGNGSNIYITDTEADGPGILEVTINEPEALTASAVGTHNICYGAAVGSATVTAFGGTAPYSYLWSNGGTADMISNLAAGNYTVTVTDANGCSTTAQFEVTQPAQLVATATGTSTSCVNSASVSAIGGTGSYSYLWSNGATTQTISSIPAGTYTVTVTDQNGCTASASVTVSGNQAFNPSVSTTDVSCFGGTNGTLTVTNANGVAPFTYSLDGINFQASNVFSGLAAGTYTVTVKDALGCTGFNTKTIGQPSQLVITLNSVQSTCFGSNNGSINTTASGGSPAFSYSWRGPGGYTASSSNISNLAAGNYTLTVTDSKGCTATHMVTVPSYPQINLSSVVNNIACKGEQTGSIDNTLTGGSGAGFSYLWNSGATIEDRTNLGPGNYSFTATDLGTGCQVSQTFTITQPATSVNLSVTKSNATDCSLGTIMATGSGGTAPYQYRLDAGTYQASGVFTGLHAGTYTVWVKDANGCTKTAVQSITDNGGDVYESNNSKNQSKVITIGTVHSARIGNATDVDWFRFTTPAGNASYTLTVSHPVVSYSFNLYVAGNNTPALTPVSTGSNTKVYALSGNTTYYIQVSGTLNYTCYQLSVSSGGPVTRSSGGSQPQNEAGTKIAAVEDMFEVKVFGNPASTDFSLQVMTGSKEKIKLRIMDVSGRLLEVRENIQPLQLIRIGQRYISGVYMAEITQGENRKLIRLIKQ